jgi:hypothetical protein
MAAIDRLRATGFKPISDFQTGLRATINSVRWHQADGCPVFRWLPAVVINLVFVPIQCDFSQLISVVATTQNDQYLQAIYDFLLGA